MACFSFFGSCFCGGHSFFNRFLHLLCTSDLAFLGRFAVFQFFFWFILLLCSPRLPLCNSEFCFSVFRTVPCSCCIFRRVLFILLQSWTRAESRKFSAKEGIFSLTPSAPTQDMLVCKSCTQGDRKDPKRAVLLHSKDARGGKTSSHKREFRPQKTVFETSGKRHGHMTVF